MSLRNFVENSGELNKLRFFDPELVKSWLKSSTVTVDKGKLIQQTSIMLSDLANLSAPSLLTPTVKINLGSRPDFLGISTKSRSKKAKKAKEVMYLSPHHVVNLVNLHLEQNSDITSRLLFQLCTGCRFENSIFYSSGRQHRYDFSLSPHSKVGMHRAEQVCEFICLECYHVLTVETKTNLKEKLYIHPYIFNLTRKLMAIKTGRAINTLNQETNKFVAEFLNPEFSSHTVRKTLTNLSLSSRNTGRWRSETTISNSYLHFTTRISDLMEFIKTRTKFVECQEC